MVLTIGRVKTPEIQDFVQEYHQHLASMGGLFYGGASTSFAFLAAAVAADNATSRVACIQHGKMPVPLIGHVLFVMEK